MKNIVSDLQRQGYKKVGFYVGDAHLLYSPGTQCGAITFGEGGVFDEIYIRYDDPDYSPRQLGLHEVGHQIYNTPYGQKIASIIKNSMPFTERSRVLSSERYQRYMTVLEDESLVFEEFVCDILGGMTKYADMFEDIATAFRNNDKVYIDNYKVSEYNKLIDTGDPNASVLESIGLGNDYRLSESFGDIPYREYVQLRNYIVQKNNSTDALLSTDCKEIGDNFYIWNNTSKTDFTVVGSIPIVGNEDFINAIRSYIQNGTYRGAENLNTRANRIRSGKRGRALLDGRTSRSATDGNNDRLSVRQPGSNTGGYLVENSGIDTPISQTFKSAGTSQIARILKDKKILTPFSYWNSKGQSFKSSENPYNWSADTIAGIIEKKEYLGHTVNFKTYKQSYKSKKKCTNPEEKQLIFENTHEAIIDADTWERVQELRKNKRRPSRTGKSNMFSGVAYCADCGQKLYYCTSKYFESRQDHFVCSTSRKGKEECSTHFIRATILEQGVLAHLKYVIGAVASYENQFRKVLGAKQKAEVKKELNIKKKLLSKSESRIKELDLLFQRIYEDNVSKKISDERFEMLSANYENEQAELKQIIEKLSAKISETEEQSDNVERFIKKVHKYLDLQELTPSILNDLVKRVYVHTPQKIDGKRTQDIEIVYDMVGILPLSLLNGNDKTA